MANLCSNSVKFTGSKANLKKVTACFREMADYCDDTDEGALPDFIEKEQEGLFQNVYVNKVGDFSYDTDDSSNELDLVTIADHFDLEFDCVFSELSMGVFGKATYKNKVLTIKNLETSEIDSLEEDDEGFYVYNDEYYECQGEALLDMLEEKNK